MPRVKLFQLDYKEPVEPYHAMTYAEISRELGLSQEVVRNIEIRALQKIRQIISRTNKLKEFKP